MTRLQTQLFQIFLMILIIIHNTSTNLISPVTHWPLSEFYWQSNYLNLYQILLHQTFLTWRLIPLLINSLGYTAVASFLILTGYGLYKRYENTPLEFLPYFKNRLVYLLIPWLVTSLWIECNMAHSPSLFHWILIFSSIQLWIPPDQDMLLGPWWFIGMIFELYLIFPIILSSYKKHGFKLILCLIFIQYFTQVFINPWTNSWGLNLNLTPVSALMPIAIGLVLARAENFKILKINNFLVILLSLLFLALFFLAQINFYTWPIANSLLGLGLLGILLVGMKLWGFEKLERSRFINHLRELIAPGFLVHGYIYIYFIIWLKAKNINFLTYLLILILVLALTYICSVLVLKITNLVKPLIKK